MKVEVKKFVEFLTISTLNGKFDSVVLNFKSEGVNIHSKDEDNTTMNISFMSSESFQTYKYFEKPVGVRSSKMLIGVLKSFSGIVNLNITDDLLTIYNENKSASLKTANVMYLDKNSFTAAPGVFEKFDAGVKINSDIFKNSVKNMSIVSGDEISINIKDKIISIETGDDKSDRITEKMSCEYKDVKAGFNSELFKSVIDVIPGEVNLSLISDYSPLQLKYETESFRGRILLAPTGNSKQDEEKYPVVEVIKENVTKTKVESFEKEHPEKEQVSTKTTIDDLVNEDIKDLESDSLDAEDIDGLL